VALAGDGKVNQKGDGFAPVEFDRRAVALDMRWSEEIESQAGHHCTSLITSVLESRRKVNRMWLAFSVLGSLRDFNLLPLDKRPPMRYNFGIPKSGFRMISISMQEYLQAIYRLESEKAPVSTTALAESLELAPASITGMVRKLHQQGLVNHTPYQGVTLTQEGRQEALRLVRIHRLWELFLSEVLDVSWDKVHEEAHRLEHATSDRLADRLAEFLHQPKTDPHGQRIPSREGALPERDSLPLSQVDVGQQVSLVEVPDGDPELLRYLAQLGLYPGAEVRVVAVAPFNGPVTFQVADSEQVLGRELARRLLVIYREDKKDG
jgi:DtxR family Mn-dependent transcriptional regulator